MQPWCTPLVLDTEMAEHQARQKNDPLESCPYQCQVLMGMSGPDHQVHWPDLSEQVQAIWKSFVKMVIPVAHQYGDVRSHQVQHSLYWKMSSPPLPINFVYVHWMRCPHNHLSWCTHRTCFSSFLKTCVRFLKRLSSPDLLTMVLPI